METFNLATYLPIFLYLVVILGMVVSMLVMAHILGPKRDTPVKLMPYESGMDPVGDARQHFDVKFYLIAILFLVFDVELLFLYPWATVAYEEGGLPAMIRGPVFVTMLVFIATLAVAYVYAWRKGVFKWR
jgi:NADH:ubiquinone oxidoreductase subunit 3 (subunit A)